MAVKKSKASAPEKMGELIADVTEETAVETYWHAAGRARMRKPPKGYPFVEELAHLLVQRFPRA